MTLEPIASNMTVLKLNNGNEYLFSYSTPVAKLCASTLFVTNEFHSNTTSKHINKWMKMLGRRKHEKTYIYPENLTRELDTI